MAKKKYGLLLILILLIGIGIFIYLQNNKTIFAAVSCVTPSNCPSNAPYCINNYCSDTTSCNSDSWCLKYVPSKPYCNNGWCSVATCTPSCSGKVCGDNGCGGSCGTCETSKTCSFGQCIIVTGSCYPIYSCTSWLPCAEGPDPSIELKQWRTCIDTACGNPSYSDSKSCTIPCSSDSNCLMHQNHPYCNSGTCSNTAGTGTGNNEEPSGGTITNEGIDTLLNFFNNVLFKLGDFEIKLWMILIAGVGVLLIVKKKK